jgi:Mn-dependent DtxR family transcriptional regulator
MACEAGGKSEFFFTHGAAKKYGVKKSSFDVYIRKLIEGGFIERIEYQGMPQYARARFRFSISWKTCTQISGG